MVISFFDDPYKITTGFFLENTIVVAEGEMLAEGIFQVLVNISFVISGSCSLNFVKPIYPIFDFYAFIHKPCLSMKFTTVASCMTSKFYPNK